MDLKSLASINRANFAIKSYSIEHGYPSLRRSLVDDAKFETLKNKEAKKNWLQEIKRNSQDKDISEEEVFIENENIEPQKNLSTNVLLTLKNPGLINLYRILKLVEISNGKIEHLETRKNFSQTESLKIDCGEIKSEKYFDLFLNLDISKSSLLHLIKSLRHGNLADVTILKEQLISIKDPWFPRHIKELDFCSHILTKYEPDLDSDHPGFSDLVYRERRKKIADIAFEYKYGEEIPKIDYTPDEIKTWKIVYTKLQELYPTHACKQFNENFKVLEKECGYSPEFIPQLNDVSNFLRKKTGFTLRPAAGLLTARDFLSSLAFRVFQCTQYMRHSSLPHHSNEPDCVHELLGHVPMFVDPTFAQFSQEIGLASLGASDEDIEKFATLYWFTVEFGLCLQDGEKKAYGAGLLSSFGELKHALTDVPKHYPLDLEKASVQPYRDDIYNETYFIAESFQHARTQLRKFVQEKLPRKFEVHYDPFTQQVNIIDNLSKLSLILDNLNSDLNRLNNAVNKLKIVKNV